MDYVIGIDVGTSGTKTVLFDAVGLVIASKTWEYPMHQPQNGWAEQAPGDWWRAVCETVSYVVKKSGVDASHIKGVGLSGQMHGLVMLDGNKNVLRNAILWCDQRTAAECAEITAKVGAKKLVDITANPAVTGFTASKIQWVKNNEPEIYDKCRHILLPKDYIRFMLTGEMATDVSDASGMQLLDVPNRCWSDEILRILEIDKGMLARVYESPEVTGTVTKEAAALTGLKEGIPVVGGAGDNAAAAVGNGIVTDGKAFTTLGTSGVVYAHTEKPLIDPSGRVHTFCCAVPGAWHVMGVTQAAGLSLKWFRDNFCQAEIQTASGLGMKTYELMTSQAERSPIGSNRLIYLPYLMGERTPHLDPNCRGVFFGLSAIHTKNDMIRAVMEGVTFSQRDSAEVLREMGVVIEDMFATGGGASSPMWRQMLADVLNCDVRTVAHEEGPALGVAILAGVGAGLYKNVKDGCNAVIQVNAARPPARKNHELYEKYYEIYRGLYPKLKDSFVSLQSI